MWNRGARVICAMCNVGSHVDNRSMVTHGPVCTNKEGGKSQYAHIACTCMSALCPLNLNK